MAIHVPADWWTTFYDDLYADLFLARGDGQLNEIPQFLIKSLRIKPGDRVLDQCCGIGRLAAALAGRGATVVGVDQCEAYIRRAETMAGDAGVSCSFVRTDAFEYVPAEPCTAAFNWHTSFGYAGDARNLRMLERARDALEPGGRFALDFPHVEYLLRNFEKRIEYRHETTNGGVTVIRESELDPTREYLFQRWTFELTRGRHTRASRLRLYAPGQLDEMLRQAGFEDVDFRRMRRAASAWRGNL
jgi:SAM-dependent methyltransferase